MKGCLHGYTLSLGHTGTHVVNGAIYPLQYDLLNDFEPVALLASNTMILVTRNDAPPKNFRELIDWLKDNPGKVAVGTAGVGSASHFSGVYFQNLIKAQFNFVPYRGTGPALQDLVAGQIDMIVDQVSNAITHVQAGKIRALAVTSPKRLGVLPDVPTMAEAGFKGAESQSFFAIVAPQGTPAAIVETLHAALVKSLQAPDLRQRLDQLGAVPLGNGPQEAAAYVARESARWAQVVLSLRLHSTTKPTTARPSYSRKRWAVN